MDTSLLLQAAINVANSRKYLFYEDDGYTRIDVINSIVTEYLALSSFKPTTKELVQLKKKAELYVPLIIYDKLI